MFGLSKIFYIFFERSLLLYVHQVCIYLINTVKSVILWNIITI